MMMMLFSKRKIWVIAGFVAGTHTSTSRFISATAADSSLYLTAPCYD